MRTLENLQDEVQTVSLRIRPEEYQVLIEQTDGTIAQIENFICLEAKQKRAREDEEKDRREFARLQEKYATTEREP